MFKLIVVAAVLMSVAMASCPNRCSGNGRCGRYDKCTCFPGFTGPDCSERYCKFGVAWVDGSSADPHTYAECSNKGICNRATGECSCFEGYEGAACVRSVCPNKCSGHGTCEYIQDLGSYNNASTAWDYNKIQGCRCDGGWGGDDCSKRLCPRGDDPLTYVADTTKGDIWVVHIDIPTASVTTFDTHFIVTDLYGTTHVSRPFQLDSTVSNMEDNVAEALNAMEVFQSTFVPADGDIDVNLVASIGKDGLYSRFSVYIYLNNPARVNLITVADEPCEDAGCYPKHTNHWGDDVTGYVESSVWQAADPLLETDVCSNRGLCNADTGKCSCFEGFYGLACEMQTILV